MSDTQEAAQRGRRDPRIVEEHHVAGAQIGEVVGVVGFHDALPAEGVDGIGFGGHAQGGR